MAFRGIWGHFAAFWDVLLHFGGILGHFRIGAFLGIASRLGPPFQLAELSLPISAPLVPHPLGTLRH